MDCCHCIKEKVEFRLRSIGTMLISQNMEALKTPLIPTYHPTRKDYHLPSLSSSAKINRNPSFSGFSFRKKMDVDNRSEITKLPQMTPAQRAQERALRKRNSKVKKIKRQRSKVVKQEKEPLVEETKIEPKLVEEPEEDENFKKVPKFGFGVAYQISRLMIKLRRNSVDKKEVTVINEPESKSPTAKTNGKPINESLLNPKWTLGPTTKDGRSGILPPLDAHAHSTVMPLPSKFNHPMKKSRSSNALMMQEQGLNLREQALEKQTKMIGSWGTLRNRIINAKISDVLSNIKFTVNGHHYRALRCIGEGGYAKVYEVFNDANELFALKVVNLNDSKAYEELTAEIEFLKDLGDSSKVINMVEYELKDCVKGVPFISEDQLKNANPGSKNWLFLLLERGELDLEKIIRELKSTKSLTPCKLRYFWEQMLECVHAIHQHGIIHADIKPANFLMVQGQLKLIDFGLACKIPENETSAKRSFVAGTKDFLSPEVYETYVIDDGVLNVAAMKEQKDASTKSGFEVSVSTKADIWALGIILYQWVYNNSHPYSAIPGGKYSRIKALTSLDVPIDLDPLEDPLLLDTIRLCLEKRVENRPNAKELLKHPFLNPFSF